MSAQPHAHTQRTASLGAHCFAVLCFAPPPILSLASVLRTCGRRSPSRSLLSRTTTTHTYTHTHALLVLALGSDDETTGLPCLLLGVRCCCSFAATLGRGHPKTLTARANLAITLHNLGEVRRAEAEYQAVLEASIVQLGSDHEDTLSSMWDLCALLAADCFARPPGFVFALSMLLLLLLLLTLLCGCACATADVACVWLWLWR
eukprot:COSAG06_NODE_394_length_16313_cov_11.756568_5_plen_204_part_00